MIVISLQLHRILQYSVYLLNLVSLWAYLLSFFSFYYLTVIHA